MTDVSRTQHEDPQRVIVGRVRIDHHTRRLAIRIEKGDIAVIDHADLDREAAEALVASGAAAILNASPCSTGRHPVLGASIIAEAGIVLVDDLGPDVMTLKEGDRIELRGTTVVHGQTVVATGNIPQTTHPAAESTLGSQIAAFVSATDTYIEYDGDTVLRGQGHPTLNLSLEGRIVLLVLDSADTPRQLRDLRHWIRDVNPVVVGVDGGADHARRAHLHPALIVGDMELMSEKVVRSRVERVVRAGHDGVAPGKERLQRMGVDYQTIEMSGSSEDTAVSILTFQRPQVVVVVGGHHSVEDLLDRGRAAMSPAFFTRAVAGDLLVPAPAIAATYRPRVRFAGFALLFLALLCAVGAALWSTPWGHDVFMNLFHSVASVTGVDTAGGAHVLGDLTV